MKGRLIRALDRAAGVPALLVLGALRGHREHPIAPARIGVLKTRGVGDAILGSVVTAGLRQAFPGSEIVLFGEAAVASIAALLPGVTRGIAINPFNLAGSAAALRRERLDLLVDLGSWARMDALISALSDAGFVLGFRTPGQARHFAYGVTVDHSASLHEAHNYQALLQAAAGPAAGDQRPRLVPPKARDAAAAEATRPLQGRRYAVLHPWGGGGNPRPREWPADNWRRLIGWLHGQGLYVAITGAAADRSQTRSLLEGLPVGLSGDPSVMDLSGLIPLPQMYWVLEQASIVISVNTGIMHMAAVMDLPTLGLHGPTDPRRWGPLGARATALLPEGGGCGYLNLGFEYRGQPQDCMERLGYAVVEAEAERMLDANYCHMQAK